MYNINPHLVAVPKIVLDKSCLAKPVKGVEAKRDSKTNEMMVRLPRESGK